MQIVLSCFKCGGTDFENRPTPHIIVENVPYLFQEEAQGVQFVCKNCGLEDYTQNLVITFR